jgi:phage gp46-like protein
MPDIALVPSPDPLTRMPAFDVVLTEVPTGATTYARDVATDDGLDTAVYVSLFTDARADPALASDPTDLRGWWGDEFGPIGSRLWQLTRGKATDEALSFAETATRDALQWLVDTGIAAEVEASATRIGLYAISIEARIRRPGETSATFRYALSWAATVG